MSRVIIANGINMKSCGNKQYVYSSVFRSSILNAHDVSVFKV